MANMALNRRIHEVLQDINLQGNSIIVLKGIPLDVVDSESEPIPIEEAVKNKLAYFLKIAGKRKFLRFEEFLLFNSFVLDQYETIYILNNNLYISQYPIDVDYSDEVRKGLITHFAESEDDYDETEIGRIDEIIDLYDGIKEYNGFLIGLSEPAGK